jgi:hypothetical protein
MTMNMHKNGVFLEIFYTIIIIISLKWKMGLNDDATAHRANKEIVIPTTIALDYLKTQPHSHL